MNREFAERKKEKKDAEKWRHDWKMDEKEAREKENRAREREGKAPIPTPDSTPEPESPSPAEVGQVDYSMCPESDVERVEGEDTRARSPVEGSHAQPDAGALE